VHCNNQWYMKEEMLIQTEQISMHATLKVPSISYAYTLTIPAFKETTSVFGGHIYMVTCCCGVSLVM
jgi:hypothetical protein